MQTFIRWAGSKRLLLPTLRTYWPGNHARYVEPFAGSAALFFSLEPGSALLGDLNGNLIQMLDAVRREPQSVIDALRAFPRGRRAYYQVRGRDSALMDDVQAAAWFIYLNQRCFNGLYRTNRSGRFNVPYSPHLQNRIALAAKIRDASRRLAAADLVHGDFELTLAQVQPGDFVYLDPPYFVSTRRVFTEYGANPFGADDLNRLRSALDGIHEKKAMFVISYADSPEARHLLAKWNPRRIRTRRHISGFVSSRRHAYELLATNLEHK